MKCAALLLFLLVSGCGGAPADAQRDAGAEPLPTGGWRIMPSESRLGFTATQTGNVFDGEFRTYQATIIFDPNDLASASIDVTVDMRSARTGDRQRDEALPTGDWFDARNHQTARFHSETIEEAGDGYIARGTLSMRGASKELDLPFTVEIDGDRATARGETTLVRTDWGVGRGEFATGQWVGLDVTVKVEVTATR